MSEVSQQITDGQRADAVVRNLAANAIKLRPVQEADCELLWQWANDPVIRSLSFSSEYISWSDHLQWFASKLGNRNCLFYIALNQDNLPIGQVRYEIINQEATISLAISASFRGLGYGRQIILLGCQELGHGSLAKKINAYVKPNNLSSINVFLKAGFQNTGETIVKGQPALHFIKILSLNYN
jgi:UDP-2,4-diacetamido-2,4,6-trideoxy-beta-L-altropyranose hydrolase